MHLQPGQTTRSSFECINGGQSDPTTLLSKTGEPLQAPLGRPALQRVAAAHQHAQRDDTVLRMDVMRGVPADRLAGLAWSSQPSPQRVL
jgi:hypothetical protein